MAMLRVKVLDKHGNLKSIIKTSVSNSDTVILQADNKILLIVGKVSISGDVAVLEKIFEYVGLFDVEAIIYDVGGCVKVFKEVDWVTVINTVEGGDLTDC